MDFSIKNYQSSEIKFEIENSLSNYGDDALILGLSVHIKGHESQHTRHHIGNRESQYEDYIDGLTRDMAISLAIHILKEFKLVDVIKAQLKASALITEI
jgi:hypothetical protein